MSRPGWISRPLVIGLLAVASIVALTWALEHAVPSPYSGYLAVVVVGLIGTEIYKRQPRQRAARLFRLYLAARARGADELAARQRLLAVVVRNEEARRRAAGDVEAAWRGRSEKDRVMAGAAVLLARTGVRIDGDDLAAVYDRTRDRFTIRDWQALPSEFVDAVNGRLEPGEREQLQALVERYRVFEQKFFRRPTSLAADAAAAVTDFARLLHSMGNQLATDQPGDAERAYRLSLRLRPDRNLAHAGLALLLERTGRTREAAGEARAGLVVLDDYQQRAAEEPPSTEDISPFKSPTSLRQALERVVATG